MTPDQNASILSSDIVRRAQEQLAAEHLGGDRPCRLQLDPPRGGVGKVEEILLDHSKGGLEADANARGKDVGGYAENEIRAAARNIGRKGGLFKLKAARRCK